MLKKIMIKYLQQILLHLAKFILDKVSSTNFVREIYIEKNHDKIMVPSTMINAYMMVVSEKFNKKIA